MIKANELRIGNIVFNDEVSVRFGDGTKEKVRDGDVITIKNIVDRGVNYELNLCAGDHPVPILDSTPFEELYPIPLTEEWQLKLGLDKEICGLTLSMAQSGDGVKWIVQAQNKTLYIAEPEFVHQCQNIWFALTNIELQLKL